MKKIETELEDCYILEPNRFGDNRGYFSPVYINQELKELGFENLVQISRSKSSKGVLRGMHFQHNPKCQAKIVEVIKGRALDVVVDLRKNSKTYKKWTSVLLTDENNRQLYVPRGFAHGYLSLEDDTVFQYFIDNDYAPDMEGGIPYNDKSIGIDWNKIFEEYDISVPNLSEKDTNRLELTEQNIEF